MTALAIEHMGARFCGDDGFVVFLERLDACIGNPDLPVRVVEQGFNRPHGKSDECVLSRKRGGEEGMSAGWQDDESSGSELRNVWSTLLSFCASHRH